MATKPSEIATLIAKGIVYDSHVNKQLLESCVSGPCEDAVEARMVDRVATILDTHLAAMDQGVAEWLVDQDDIFISLPGSGSLSRDQIVGYRLRLVNTVTDLLQRAREEVGE